LQDILDNGTAVVSVKDLELLRDWHSSGRKDLQQIIGLAHNVILGL